MLTLNPRRAIISVSDKTGIVILAKQLLERGVELYSTGGTSAILKKHHIPVIDISDYTHFPEIMDGRVKTLHPKIYGGILRRPQDTQILSDLDIKTFDFVIVNLYPFAKTIENLSHSQTDIIEQIDIGGPCLLRAAAKNFQAVTVICDPNDYAEFISNWHDDQIDLNFRQKLMVKAFSHTAAYDTIIANYFAKQFHDTAETFSLHTQKISDLRYGENPHQKAGFYQLKNATKPCLALAEQIQGKELSYNNIADADAALSCVSVFNEPACVIVKHANPCGVAVGVTIEEAYTKAYTTDPTSAFGGIIAVNRPLTAQLAKHILIKQFVEVIIAPFIEEGAREVLAEKPNIRLLSCNADLKALVMPYDIKCVSGGMLIQDADNFPEDYHTFQVVTAKQPTEQQYADLIFAWQVVKFVKSNAIVFAKDHMTLGIGAGQMSRIDSTTIAAHKAQKQQLNLTGAVMASDAFFPFADNIEMADKHGISAIIQPGGSMRDNEVIEAANKAGIAMIFTGIRHFKH